MRATFVMPLAQRLGGAEQMLWDLVRWAPSGLEPSVVFLAPGPMERDVAGLGVPTWVIDAGRLRQPVRLAGASVRLGRILRAQRPDVVVSWMPKAHLYTAPAASAAGLRRRLVWWQHGIPTAHWMDRLATRLPTVAVGCSSATSQRAQQALLPHRPTFVVNPGIDAARLRAQAATEPRAQLRARLGIPPERAVIAVAARLQPDKGQDRLLEAVALLRRDGVDAHCLVVGGDAHGLSPEYAAGLPRLAARLGLGDRVTFAGQVAEVAPYLAAADVVVNAAEGEAFGIAILEAMAVGCPIVAVAAAGPAEILEPGVTGVLAADGQPATLAADLATLLADESRRARLGAAARVAVERRFTSTRMAERLAAELGALALG